ncbi:MAG TPA: helix-turn-helix transcriptional regulator [Acidimicrobiales bacterium]
MARPAATAPLSSWPGPARLPRDEAIGQGRSAPRARAWAAAAALLAEADAAEALDAADLQLLAEATYLVGREVDALALWTRTHRSWLAEGAKPAAARCAFWIGLILDLRGDQAQAGGWIARAERLADEAGDCVEVGYVRFYVGMGQLETGDVVGAAETLGQAAVIAERFGDADLLAFTRMASGQTAMWLGRQAEGLAMLDEAMVSVTAGEVSAVAAGIVYCALIMACHYVFDLRRAAEWTEALSGWCAAQPDLVPYRGNCQVHRAEVLALRGQWDAAGAEAEQAQDNLGGTPAAADAHYQRGEVHRLRGELVEAEGAFRQAADLGRSPQPGLCLVRLAQGDVPAAAASARRLLGETAEPPFRARLLGAMVEVLLADGDVAAARAAADELAGFGAAFDSPLLRATAGSAAGAVLLAEGNPGGACETLRRTADAWRALDVPYELARTRALLGVACAQLGDADSAAMEFDGARRALTALGAGPALRVADELAAGGSAGAGAAGTTPGAGPLTAREVEVLALLATGRTNKAIAAELVISEKTVARHVANIFIKLDLSSRSGATAYAYEHGLV